MTKRPTHCERVLELLRDGKPHSHLELYALGTVAHSRISDLRRKGCQIEQWREGDLYLYQLRSEPSLCAAESPTLPRGEAGSAAQSEALARPGSTEHGDDTIAESEGLSLTLFDQPRQARPAWA